MDMPAEPDGETHSTANEGAAREHTGKEVDKGEPPTLRLRGGTVRTAVSYWTISDHYHSTATYLTRIPPKPSDKIPQYLYQVAHAEREGGWRGFTNLEVARSSIERAL